MEFSIQLRRGKRRPRVLDGHPWVFANEVEGDSLPPAGKADGGAVALKDPKGRFLGAGIYNGDSQIIWRRFSREPCAFDHAFLAGALDAALARRGDERFCRLVWSEADGIPGLVVDRFEEEVVVQALTLAVDQQLDTIAKLLSERLKPAEIVYRNDAPTRALEGLELEVRTRSGAGLPPRVFAIDGIACELDLMHAQKTGFYLDQRVQHRRVAGLAAGRRVLDAFCNQGSFGLQCAKAGAAGVLGIDSLAEAIERARLNAARNELEAAFEEANVFDWFTAHRDERFGLIVLDPPSFARNRRALAGALRGYKELHLRALNLLAPGGVLASYACSQHVTREAFFETLREAAADAGAAVRLIERTGQPPDHPVLLNFPESEYLKGLIVEKV